MRYSLPKIKAALLIDYEIKPRPAALRAGSKLLVREDGIEIAGRVFPAGDEGYADPLNVAASFLPNTPSGPDTSSP